MIAEVIEELFCFIRIVLIIAGFLVIAGAVIGFFIILNNFEARVGFGAFILALMVRSIHG